MLASGAENYDFIAPTFKLGRIKTIFGFSLTTVFCIAKALEV